MLDIKGVVRTTGKAISKNSPAILTALAVAGVVTTTVLAVRSTPKAVKLLEEEAEVRRKEDPDFEKEFFTPVETIKITWKCYTPTAAMGVATMACIIGVNSINARRTAALASAYSLTETAFKEYQEKIVEHIGEKEEKKVRDKINEDRVHNNPVVSKEIIVTGTGKMLCYDSLTGRYFESSIEALRRAENDINSHIITHMYASQNDFYDKIGLSRIPYGEEVGWTVGNMIDLDFTTMMSEGETPRPCVVVEHRTLPKPDYFRGY